MVKLYGFCLSIAYIARQRHPYIESLPTLWYLGPKVYIIYGRSQFCFRWFINLFLTFLWVQSSPVHLSPVISNTIDNTVYGHKGAVLA